MNMQRCRIRMQARRGQRRGQEVDQARDGPDGETAENASERAVVPLCPPPLEAPRPEDGAIVDASNSREVGPWRRDTSKAEAEMAKAMQARQREYETNLKIQELKNLKTQGKKEAQLKEKELTVEIETLRAQTVGTPRVVGRRLTEKTTPTKGTKKKTTPTKGTKHTKVNKITAGAKPTAATTPMATPGSAVFYKGAKLLCSESKQGFRVWLEPKKVEAEKVFRWKGTSKEDAWLTAFKHIDEHSKSK